MSHRGWRFLEKTGFNLTQGMALLLLKPLNLPANLVLNLIIFITNPKNNIGYWIMIGSLPKLIALLMVLLLVGSTFVGGIIYFVR